MEKVELYKCKYCGSVGQKEKIEACERSCKRKKEKKEKEKKERQERKKFLDKLRLEASSIDEAIQLVIKYSKQLGYIVTFEQYPNKFHFKCSNTHCCPINGIKNWHRDKDKPSGYPGFIGYWKGSIVPIDKNKKGNRDTDIHTIFDSSFNDTCFRGFNTGSGSCGGNFDISGTIFLDDFPKIKKKYELYLELVEKENKYLMEESRRKNMIETLIYKAIEGHKEILKLKEEILKLREEVHKNEKEIESKKNIITKNFYEKFAEELKVPDSFNYDKDKLKEMYKIFNT